MMSTLVQVAGEAVSLEFCGICKDLYTEWKNRPNQQCDSDSEGAGACLIMCTSPTVLPALRLEHVQSKSSAQRLSEGKKLPTVKIDETARQNFNKRVGISKKVMAEVHQGGTSNSQRWCFIGLRKVTASRTAALVASELVKLAQAVAARIALWAGTARVAAATAAMMGATLAVTILVLVVGLVLGVRRAKAKMEVGIV